MWEKIVHWVKAHPYLAGAIGIGLVVLIYLLFFSGSSSSSSTSSTDAAALQAE